MSSFGQFPQRDFSPVDTCDVRFESPRSSHTRLLAKPQREVDEEKGSLIRFEHYRQEKKTGENALMTFMNLMFHLKNCVLPGKETCQTRLIILTPTRRNRV